MPSDIKNIGCDAVLANDYNLKISTEQTVDGDSTIMNFEMNASYVKINGTRYISYIEKDEALSTKMRTTIKIKDNNTVTIIKGKSEGMVLDESRVRSCRYPTAYGAIMFDVHTYKITNTLEDDGGELELQYSLCIDGSELSRNTLRLVITSK